MGLAKPNAEEVWAVILIIIGGLGGGTVVVTWVGRKLWAWFKGVRERLKAGDEARARELEDTVDARTEGARKIAAESQELADLRSRRLEDIKEENAELKRRNEELERRVEEAEKERDRIKKECDERDEQANSAIRSALKTFSELSQRVAELERWQREQRAKKRTDSR
ncbi:MAG TPA: hypothetical protein VF717_09420 [Pyrinomonadaceae bacterium]|jgi:DNA repair exonuclease SbcCD ATPase subunit